MAENRAPVPAAPAERLNPMDMAGKGQTLSTAERLRVDNVAALAETKRKGEEDTKAAEMALLKVQREAVAEEQAEKTKAALADAEAQRKGFLENRARLQPLSVDPATLALEASLNAQIAAALEQDETIPGGLYQVGDDLVDADGRVVGKAEKD